MVTMDDSNDKIIQYTTNGKKLKTEPKTVFFSKPTRKLNQSHILKTTHT